MELLNLNVVGSAGVGKAALLERFGGGAGRRPVSVPGAAPVVAVVTARRDDASCMAALAEGAPLLLVYDITDASSFEHAVAWLARAAGSACGALGLVGNKSDRAGERKVPARRGMDAAVSHGASFLETSATQGANVDDAFCDVLFRAATCPRPAGGALGLADGSLAARIASSLESLGIAADVARRSVQQLRPQREADGIRVMELAMATQWEAAPGSAPPSDERAVESLTTCGIPEGVARSTVRQLQPLGGQSGLRLMELAMATQWSLT